MAIEKRKATGRAVLIVRELKLRTRLGWSPAERKTAQFVGLELKIGFRRPPRACATDELGDTVCYDQLSSKILSNCGGREYRLVERLAAEVYAIVREETSHLGCLVRVVVHKTDLPIAAIHGGVSFEYGDKLE